jgi:hypothetical protein
MLMTRVPAWTAATITNRHDDRRRTARASSGSIELANERAFRNRDCSARCEPGDRQAVASLVRYPARVSVLQRPFPIYIKDRSALEQMYDMVFTPHLRCAVVDSREPVRGEAPTQAQHCSWLAACVPLLGVA